MAIKRKTTLIALHKKVQELEDRLAVREAKTGRPPVIVSFSSYRVDGTVPDLLDRRFKDWEICKNNPVAIILDLETERALRSGLLASNSILDSDHRIIEKLPELTEDEKIPFEIFIAWLGSELMEMGFLLMGDPSSGEMFTIDRNRSFVDVVRKAAEESDEIEKNRTGEFV